MNIYADRGNLLLLERRCAWRGIGFEVAGRRPRRGARPRRARPLLPRRRPGPRPAAVRRRTSSRPSATRCTRPPRAARVVLAVCGGYQLLGHSYALGDERIPGIGLVDLHTVREDGPRLIGNVAIEVELPGLDGARVLAGFENHGGRTHLGAGEQPLGRVLRGPRQQRARRASRASLRDHVIGTYLHGPLLPKNAWFADWLIATALGRRRAARAARRRARGRRPRRRRRAAGSSAQRCCPTGS